MYRSSNVLLVLLSSIICSIQAQSTTKQCYYPNKSTSTTDTPCDANADVSACCSPGDLCLANGLCLNYGRLSRGSCTDSTFSSSQCPQICLNYPQGCPITPCWGPNGAGLFACGFPQIPGDGRGDCQNASFSIPLSGFRIALRQDQAPSLPGSARVTIDYSTGILGVATPTTCPTQATVTTTPGFRFSVGQVPLQ